MESKLSYTEACAKLEALVELLEDGQIPLDKLSDKIKQANELVAICEARLRAIETEIDTITNS